MICLMEHEEGKRGGENTPYKFRTSSENHVNKSPQEITSAFSSDALIEEKLTD